jgi:hypothetical protein
MAAANGDVYTVERRFHDDEFFYELKQNGKVVPNSPAFNSRQDAYSGFDLTREQRLSFYHAGLAEIGADQFRAIMGFFDDTGESSYR